MVEKNKHYTIIKSVDINKPVGFYLLFVQYAVLQALKLIDLIEVPVN